MKTITAFVAVLFLAVISFTGMAKAADFPVSGSYTVANGFTGTFRAVEVDKANKTVTVSVPTIAAQLEKENISGPTWQMSASHCWYNGSWILATEDANSGYALSTVPGKDGNLLVTTKPLKENSRYAWYRFWGQDTKSGKWLWINQSDAHNRNDANGNPGYEIMVDYETGTTQIVSSAYDIRK